ncbi:MAG TPA: HD domain-containing protein [Candidatus Atribacteria bacterium]|nr:HD domain-containing protein [Candidatus Atribacteria bacterium]
MKDEDKEKSQLIKELQEIREKVTNLEEIKLKYNRVNRKLEQADKKLKKMIETAANIINKVVEIRDPYSIGHQQRVSQLATTIAQEMELPKSKIEGVKIASLVHDIGKLNVPIEIISKPHKLIDVEFNLIKNYPKVGYDIFKKVDFPWDVAQIVFQHQEKIDGSGYPRGLKGDEICIEAKIVGVANVIEAMSSYKSYRHALSIDEALHEIDMNKNILFDAEVVDACIKLFKEKGFKFES